MGYRGRGMRWCTASRWGGCACTRWCCTATTWCRYPRTPVYERQGRARRRDEAAIFVSGASLQKEGRSLPPSLPPFLPPSFCLPYLPLQGPWRAPQAQIAQRWFNYFAHSIVQPDRYTRRHSPTYVIARQARTSVLSTANSSAPAVPLVLSPRATSPMNIAPVYYFLGCVRAIVRSSFQSFGRCTQFP